MSDRRALRTLRFDLRPWALADAHAFHAIWGDPEVIFWGAAKDLAESRAFLTKVLGRCAGKPWPGARHAIADRAGGSVVGNAVLQPASFAPGRGSSVPASAHS